MCGAFVVFCLSKLRQCGFDALSCDQIREATERVSVMENQPGDAHGCGHIHVAAFSGVRPLCA